MSSIENYKNDEILDYDGSQLACEQKLNMLRKLAELNFPKITIWTPITKR